MKKPSHIRTFLFLYMTYQTVLYTLNSNKQHFIPKLCTMLVQKLCLNKHLEFRILSCKENTQVLLYLWGDLD